MIWFVSFHFCFNAYVCNGQELIKETKVDSLSAFFNSGSAALNNSGFILNKLKGLDKTPNYRVKLIAYTDTIGSNQSNQNLASKRLLSVSKLIQSAGIKIFGLDSLNQNENRNRNRKEVVQMNDEFFRRVDILIYKVEPNIKFNAPINLRINFESGTDRLLMGSIEYLRLLEMLMKADATLQIKLNGHVCCEPDMNLSVNRAQRVKSYLVSHGIDAKRITCKGYSNTAKLVPESTEENKRKNMRVDVVFIK